MSLMACNHQPVGRRGACCFAYQGAVYVVLGHEDPFLLPPGDVDKTLHCFLLQEGTWDSTQKAKTAISSALSGACSCVLGDGNQQFFFTFGGWKSGDRVADVHVLHLNEMSWKKCRISNPGEGPFLKDKAGMIPYGNNMICVVGGYGYPSMHHIHDGVYHGQKGAQYHWDYQSGLCWTNEVHLFHLELEKWISPRISGQGPPPCAAFTITMADSCRAVLFGGRQVNRRVNDLYILRLDTWHWEGVFLKSSPNEPWPSARSFHTVCSLVETTLVSTLSQSSATCTLSQQFDWLPCLSPDLSPDCHSSSLPLVKPRLLLLWGMDNEGEPVSDCWTLELDPISWKRVTIPALDVCEPRLWHVAGVWHPTPGEAQVVVFGGAKCNIYNEQHLDVQPRTVNDTVVFLCGVPSLYDLCINHLALLPQAAFTKLSSFLPMHLVQQVVEQAASNKHPHRFPSLRL